MEYVIFVFCLEDSCGTAVALPWFVGDDQSVSRLMCTTCGIAVFIFPL